VIKETASWQLWTEVVSGFAGKLIGLLQVMGKPD